MNFKTLASLLVIAFCISFAYGGAVIKISGNQGSTVNVDTPNVDLGSDANSEQAINQKVPKATGVTINGKSKTSDNQDIDADVGNTNIAIDNNTAGTLKSKTVTTKVTTKKK